MRRSITEIIEAPFRQEIVEGMAFDEYLKHRGLSSSVIASGSKSMLAAQDSYADVKNDATDLQTFGSVGHVVLHESEKFNDCVAVWEGGRRYGKEWNAFKEEHEGKHIIPLEGRFGFRNVSGAVQEALKKPQVKRIVQSGVGEVSGFLVENGMQCKFRCDWISNSDNCIADTKFTTNAESRSFWSNAYNRFRYGLKMAVYRRWFQLVTGSDVDYVCLIVIEQEPPHDVAVVPIPESELERGWMEAQRVITQVRRCIDAVGDERWPGVDGGRDFYELAIPTWAMEEPQLENVEVVNADETV